MEKKSIENERQNTTQDQLGQERKKPPASQWWHINQQKRAN